MLCISSYTTCHRDRFIRIRRAPPGSSQKARERHSSKTSLPAPALRGSGMMRLKVPFRPILLRMIFGLNPSRREISSIVNTIIGWGL